MTASLIRPRQVRFNAWHYVETDL